MTDTAPIRVKADPAPLVIAIDELTRVMTSHLATMDAQQDQLLIAMRKNVDAVNELVAVIEAQSV